MKTALLCTLLLVGRSEDVRVGADNVNLTNNRGVGRHEDGLDTLLAEKAQKNPNFEPEKWYPLIGQLEDGALAQRYNSARRIKGDGNCFYRAVVFSALERPGRVRDHTIYQLLRIDQREFDGVTGPTGASRKDLGTWLNGIRKTNDDIEPLYNRDIDLALVRAARALTARSMMTRQQEIAPFVWEYASVDAYCKTEVLRMGAYNDLDPQIGLPEALQLAVRIIKVNPNDRGGMRSDGTRTMAQPLMDTLHGAQFQKAGERVVTVILMDDHYSVIYEADRPAARPLPIQPAVFRRIEAEIAKLAEFAACQNDEAIAKVLARL